MLDQLAHDISNFNNLLTRESSVPSWMQSIDFAIDLLKRAATSDVSAELSSQTYWHPAGFLKVPIYRSNAVAAEWRLNIWPPGTRELALDHVHSHPWDMKSYCISGSIRERRFCIVEGDEFHKYLSDVTQTPPLDCRAGQCNLSVYHDEIVAAGDSYFIEDTTYHYTCGISSDVSVTSMVRSARTRSDAVIFRRASEVAAQSDNRSSIRYIPPDIVVAFLEGLSSRQSRMPWEELVQYVFHPSRTKCAK